MPPAQRSDISNGIWLCATHGTLIDQDTSAYTADAIRAMKSAHEHQVRMEIQGASSIAPKFHPDLIAIGPDVVVTGKLIGVNGAEWQLRVQHFVIGDIGTLIRFGEQLDQTSPDDLYVLVNTLGDGRQLAAAPALKKTADGHVVTCQVCKSFPRTSAYSLPRDFALNDDHDTSSATGTFSTVEGLDALPQKIKTCLSHQRGESPFHPAFSARLVDYFDLFRDSFWLARLVRLEVIRHACMPYSHPVLKQRYTPLMSVLRVVGIEMLNTSTKKNWVPFHFLLKVDGVGRWERDISILISPRDEQLEAYLSGIATWLPTQDKNHGA
jgi:hypothetical protein